MTMPKVETREQEQEAAVDPAKPTAPTSPTVDPKAGDKIYSQVEADGLLKAQYNTLNAKLSENGIELAKLRPLETEVETLRTANTSLNNEIDDSHAEGAETNNNPAYGEVIKMKRTLREGRTDLEADVRKHNTTVAEFGVKAAKYDTWNDQHNMENETSIAFIADKYKVSSDALKDLPKEARVAVAQAIGTQAAPAKPPVTPAALPPVNPSPIIEDGVGQGGSQLTGNAAAAEALKRAREKNRS